MRGAGPARGRDEAIGTPHHLQVGGASVEATRTCSGRTEQVAILARITTIITVYRSSKFDDPRDENPLRGAAQREDHGLNKVLFPDQIRE
jgi:hypothetical protein